MDTHAPHRISLARYTSGTPLWLDHGTPLTPLPLSLALDPPSRLTPKQRPTRSSPEEDAQPSLQHRQLLANAPAAHVWMHAGRQIDVRDVEDAVLARKRQRADIHVEPHADGTPLVGQQEISPARMARDTRLVAREADFGALVVADAEDARREAARPVRVAAFVAVRSGHAKERQADLVVRQHHAHLPFVLPRCDCGRPERRVPRMPRVSHKGDLASWPLGRRHVVIEALPRNRRSKRLARLLRGATRAE
mmetsp:Transcript_67853/g.186086  ORF Transcript_67853/g.186086 Transcript_67853/m.186086 type:complete len:250 (-) Transcript_67853:747-1496(-)